MDPLPRLHGHDGIWGGGAWPDVIGYEISWLCHGGGSHSSRASWCTSAFWWVFLLSLKNVPFQADAPEWEAHVRDVEMTESAVTSTQFAKPPKLTAQELPV